MTSSYWFKIEKSQLPIIIMAMINCVVSLLYWYSGVENCWLIRLRRNKGWRRVIHHRTIFWSQSQIVVTLVIFEPRNDPQKWASFIAIYCDMKTERKPEGISCEHKARHKCLAIREKTYKRMQAQNEKRENAQKIRMSENNQKFYSLRSIWSEQHISWWSFYVIILLHCESSSE